jgi:hypothetical protein
MAASVEGATMSHSMAEAQAEYRNHGLRARWVVGVTLFPLCLTAVACGSHGSSTQDANNDGSLDKAAVEAGRDVAMDLGRGSSSDLDTSEVAATLDASAIDRSPDAKVSDIPLPPDGADSEADRAQDGSSRDVFASLDSATILGPDGAQDGQNQGLGRLDSAVDSARDVSLVTGDARIVGNEAGGLDSGSAAETSKCAHGQTRVHVRDLWSKSVTPTLGVLTAPPTALLLNEYEGNFSVYGARGDAATDINGGTCTYYSACIPNTITQLELQPMETSGCPVGSTSSIIDISSMSGAAEFWIEYTGSSASLQTDFNQRPNLPLGVGAFHVTADSSTLIAPACSIGTPPRRPIPANYVRIHFRWPYTDPAETGYPGSACGDDKLGYSPPPYPNSLYVTGLSCAREALLELQDSKCTWYSLLIPKSAFPTNANAQVVFEHPNYLTDLITPLLTLPTLGMTGNELWIAYPGITNNTDAAVDQCFYLRYASNAYAVLTQNPGPAYPGCGDQ